MTETAEKKDVQKLQRVMVDALEDVKAQDISVYNTEHLSSLFERVIIASGTSNRQTKALAASVRDQVRKHGFAKPRIEGEENGEWIIVDCGAAVAHIMQPSIRQYYHLEEIWGDKPVRLKFGAPRPVVAKAEEPRPKSAAKKSSKTSSAAPEVIAKKVAAKKTAANNAARRFTSTQRAQKVTQYLDKEKPKAAPSSAKGAVVKRVSATGVKAAPAATVKAAAKAAPKAAPRSAAKASSPAPAKAAPKSAAKSAVKTAAKSSSKASSKSPAKTVAKPRARPRAS